MKAKFRIRALDLRGKVVHFTHSINTSNFQPIPVKNWDGLDLPETSIEEQLMNWFDDQDKTQLMYEKELGAILDYWVYKPKERKKTVSVEELFL